MKAYGNGSNSGHSFLTALQENHKANARRTKGELPQSSGREVLNPSVDYVAQEPLQKLPHIEEKLQEHLKGKMTNQRYKKMLEFRKKLPSYTMREELMDLINKNQVVVVSGETGCGKTTQVPQFILDHCIEAGQGATCRVVCTQPRRIAATSVAERVADERGENLGESVGYQIRLESRLPRKNGSILYCTTGIVLQWLRGVPLLDNVSHIVLDEIHERDIQSDFLITILRDILPRRPDLKLILMSATLNAEKFSKYYANCPMITIPGFTFPVEEFYLEDVLEMTRFKFKQNDFYSRKDNRKEMEFTGMIEPFLRDIESSGSYSRQTIESLRTKQSEVLNVELIASLVQYIHDHEREGAVLVFVPGWSEISKLNKMLLEDPKYRLKGKTVIYPLHSMMPSASQKAIFERPKSGTRKIIIATNIAETSITVDDVVYVVDGGRIKVTNFNEDSNLNSLDVQWVSTANARQRRGRAGRVQAGKCYHLYTRAREMMLDSYLLPEMCRSRLEEVVLQIKILELGDAKQFLRKVLDPPNEETVSLSIELLLTINALVINCDDDMEELTSLGYHLAQLPMDPQTGKMILLGAIFSCLDPVLSVAASLSFKDAFVIPLGKEKLADQKRNELAKNTMSDHLMLANALAEWETSSNRAAFCWEYFLSDSVMKMLHKMKQQFGQHLYKQQFLNSMDVLSMESNRNSHNEALVRAVVCAGLYPNVAKIKRHTNPKPKSGFGPAKLTSKTDPRIIFHLKSVNDHVRSFPYPWVVYHQKLKSTSVSLHDATVVSPLSLLFFGRYVRTGQDTIRDTGQQVDTVAADDYVKFNCEAATARLVQRLREHLDQLLLHKVTYPAPVDWANGQREGLVLESIVELLTTELEGIQEDDDEN